MSFSFGADSFLLYKAGGIAVSLIADFLKGAFVHEL